MQLIYETVCIYILTYVVILYFAWILLYIREKSNFYHLGIGLFH